MGEASLANTFAVTVRVTVQDGIRRDLVLEMQKILCKDLKLTSNDTAGEYRSSSRSPMGYKDRMEQRKRYTPTDSRGPP